ncbi:MAG TPA: hypothetical protein VMN39_03755 [Longimicrobiaceae bacterium]|nr:hypothetical protein [Longimicrobiaceae bacterium]
MGPISVTLGELVVEGHLGIGMRRRHGIAELAEAPDRHGDQKGVGAEAAGGEIFEPLLDDLLTRK